MSITIIQLNIFNFYVKQVEYNKYKIICSIPLNLIKNILQKYM